MFVFACFLFFIIHKNKYKRDLHASIVGAVIIFMSCHVVSNERERKTERARTRWTEKRVPSEVKMMLMMTILHAFKRRL